jgi:hypothetical protein
MEMQCDSVSQSVTRNQGNYIILEGSGHSNPN